MMQYLFIFLSLITLLDAEYEPKKVTKEDLSDLRKIDAKLFYLANEKKSYKYDAVSSFIYNNLAYDLDFTRFKVVGSASARASLQDSENIYTNESNRLRAQVMVTYPFFDAKELNERKQKIITLKQKIINDAQKYFKTKAKHDDLILERLLILKIETRLKARKLQAVGSFDEWLKIIKDLKKVNYDLSVSEIELSQAKQLLLSYVMQSKRGLLEKML